MSKALLWMLSLGVCSPVFAEAQPNKVLNIAIEAPDDGFDMVKTYNLYSGTVAEAIFEPLLSYDYLASPATLVANTALSMPSVEQDGRVYIFKLKKGIYFSNDPAFKGKRRELTMADYIYSIQRILDPKNRSTSYSFIDGKIEGGNEAVKRAQQEGKFDYSAPISGLQMLDPYTLKITLTRPDYNFPYIMAYVAFGATAKEVVDYYGSKIAQHPVGTGPYQLKKYVPRSRIELTQNPNYRGFIWNFKSTGTNWDNALVKQMNGKKMPQINQVNIQIIEEEQSRWLAFKSGQFNYTKLTSNAVPQVLHNNQLKPEYVAQGIQLFKLKMPEITYTSFNMKDPIIGGNALDKIALRRAISMAYNQKEANYQLYKNQATRAQMFLPEGVQGFSPDYKSSLVYNPALANKLLDYFKYKKGPDGYRNLPNGQPLTVQMMMENSSNAVISSELWKKNLDAIGIRIAFKVSNFADNMKAGIECKYMMWGSAWTADYPEGENFAQLLYSPNSGQGNISCYQSKAYDQLYKQAMALAPQERMPIYEKMNRQIEADTPWLIHSTRTQNWLLHPEVQGFKAHPMINGIWQYLDLQTTPQ